ncbi:unnamed protein product, partial [Symbiodinium sp. CCMP2456]
MALQWPILFALFVMKFMGVDATGKDDEYPGHQWEHRWGENEPADADITPNVHTPAVVMHMASAWDEGDVMDTQASSSSGPPPSLPLTQIGGQWRSAWDDETALDQGDTLNPPPMGVPSDSSSALPNPGTTLDFNQGEFAST